MTARYPPGPFLFRPAPRPAARKPNPAAPRRTSAARRRPAVEPLEARRLLTTLTSGSVVQSNDPIETYTLPVQSGQYVRLDLTTDDHFRRPVELSVLDPNGIPVPNPVDNRDWSESLVISRDDSITGDYEVVVRLVAPVQSYHSFSLRTFVSGTFTAIADRDRDLASGGTWTGLKPANSFNLHSFTIAPGDTSRVRLESADAPELDRWLGAYPQLTVVESTGQIVSDAFQDSFDDTELITNDSDEPRDFVAIVSSTHDRDWNYRIEVTTPTPVTETADGCDASLAGGGTQRCAGVRGQYGRHTIDIVAGQTLFLRAERLEDTEHPSNRLAAILRDPNGQVVIDDAWWTATPDHGIEGRIHEIFVPADATVTGTYVLDIFEAAGVPTYEYAVRTFVGDIEGARSSGLVDRRIEVGEELVFMPGKAFEVVELEVVGDRPLMVSVEHDGYDVTILGPTRFDDSDDTPPSIEVIHSSQYLSYHPIVLDVDRRGPGPYTALVWRDLGRIVWPFGTTPGPVRLRTFQTGTSDAMFATPSRDVRLDGVPPGESPNPVDIDLPPGTFNVLTMPIGAGQTYHWNLTPLDLPTPPDGYPIEGLRLYDLSDRPSDELSPDILSRPFPWGTFDRGLSLSGVAESDGEIRWLVESTGAHRPVRYRVAARVIEPDRPVRTYPDPTGGRVIGSVSVGQTDRYPIELTDDSPLIIQLRSVHGSAADLTLNLLPFHGGSPIDGAAIDFTAVGDDGVLRIDRGSLPAGRYAVDVTGLVPLAVEYAMRIWTPSMSTDRDAVLTSGDERVATIPPGGFAVHSVETDTNDPLLLSYADISRDLSENPRPITAALISPDGSVRRYKDSTGERHLCFDSTDVIPGTYRWVLFNTGDEPATYRTRVLTDAATFIPLIDRDRPLDIGTEAVLDIPRGSFSVHRLELEDPRQFYAELSHRGSRPQAFDAEPQLVSIASGRIIKADRGKVWTADDVGSYWLIVPSESARQSSVERVRLISPEGMSLIDGRDVAVIDSGETMIDVPAGAVSIVHFEASPGDFVRFGMRPVSGPPLLNPAHLGFSIQTLSDALVYPDDNGLRRDELINAVSERLSFFFDRDESAFADGSNSYALVLRNGHDVDVRVGVRMLVSGQPVTTTSPGDASPRSGERVTRDLPAESFHLHRIDVPTGGPVTIRWARTDDTSPKLLTSVDLYDPIAGSTTPLHRHPSDEEVNRTVSVPPGTSYLIVDHTRYSLPKVSSGYAFQFFGHFDPEPVRSVADVPLVRSLPVVVGGDATSFHEAEVNAGEQFHLQVDADFDEPTDSLHAVLLTAEGGRTLETFAIADGLAIERIPTDGTLRIVRTRGDMTLTLSPVETIETGDPVTVLFRTADSGYETHERLFRIGLEPGGKFEFLVESAAPTADLHDLRVRFFDSEGRSTRPQYSREIGSRSRQYTFEGEQIDDGVFWVTVSRSSTRAERPILITTRQFAPEVRVVDSPPVHDRTDGPIPIRVVTAVPADVDRTFAVRYGGSAVRDFDYRGPETVTIPAGETQGTLTIEPLAGNDDFFQSGSDRTIHLWIPGDDPSKEILSPNDSRVATVTLKNVLGRYRRLITEGQPSEPIWSDDRITIRASTRPTIVLRKIDRSQHLYLVEADPFTSGENSSPVLLDAERLDASAEFSDELSAEAGTTVALVFPPLSQTTDYYFWPNGSRNHRRSDHHLLRPHDVDGDGETTALDALRVLQSIRRGAAAEGLDGDVAVVEYPDVNDDGRVEPLDALMVLNELRRRRATPSPEPVAVDRLMGSPMADLAALTVRSDDESKDAIPITDPPSLF